MNKTSELLPSLLLAMVPAGALPSQGAPAGSGEPNAEQARPRSVLFYLMDTCRRDRLTYSGYRRDTTPFLEWLSKRSVVFEACYSQAPWTKPSMASMLTSQYPSTTGIYRMDQKLSDSFETWPEVLRRNGLYTAGFSTNIVMGNSLSNLAQGFDHWIEGTYINRGDAIRFASGSAMKLNAHAFSWLDRNDRWPVLLYLHSVDPHEEYEPAPEYLERFADPDRHPRFREEWKELVESRPPVPGLYVTQRDFDATDIDSGSFIAHASDLYDADILANDDQLEVLWDRLQEEGWGEDFILVFTSDHGEEFFDHGATSHGYSLYEEMIRVPLLIYAPGLFPEADEGGLRVSTPVRSLDIYPTLCDLLGFDAPEGLEGESLVPLIRGIGGIGGAGKAAPDVFSEHEEDEVLRAMGHGSGRMVSLRSGDWKYILNLLGSQVIERPRHELYDLRADPHERRNLAEARPELVTRFEKRVLAFLEKQEEKKAKAEEGGMDEETLRQLRALGYVGEEEAPDIWEVLASKDYGRIRGALEQGADPNRMEPRAGIRPLAVAALHGNLRLAEILLEAGAKIDLPNRDGSTALSSAAFLGRSEIVGFLLEEGADATRKNANGDSPLSVTRAPWRVTEYIAKALGIPVERAALEEGRERCAALLREHLGIEEEEGTEGG